MKELNRVEEGIHEAKIGGKKLTDKYSVSELWMRHDLQRLIESFSIAVHDKIKLEDVANQFEKVSHAKNDLTAKVSFKVQEVKNLKEKISVYQNMVDNLKSDILKYKIAENERLNMKKSDVGVQVYIMR